MKIIPIIALGALGYWLYVQHKNSATSTAASVGANAVTLVPTPKNATTVVNINGNALLLDTSGNYYLQQGTTAYALPLTAANAASLISTYG